MRKHRNLKLRKLVNSINHDQLNHSSQQTISPSELPVDITSLIKKCDVMLDLFYDAGLQEYIESDQPKTMRDDTESVDFRDILYAICGDEHDHDSAMNPDRISLYQFLKRLKVANNISGSIENISAGCFHLGTKKIGNCSIGFVFARKANNLLVAGIKSLCAEKKLVIITPAKKVRIADRNVINVSLAESLRDDYRLEIDLQRLDVSDQSTTLTFLDEKSGPRSYYVMLNDEKISIPYSEMALLIFLALKRKTDDEWVSQTVADREGITESQVTEGHLRKLVYNLQKSLHRKDLLLNADPDGYKLIISGDYIDVPSSNWLADTLCEILAYLEKYRERRAVQRSINA